MDAFYMRQQKYLEGKLILRRELVQARQTSHILQQQTSFWHFLQGPSSHPSIFSESEPGGQQSGGGTRPGRVTGQRTREGQFSLDAVKRPEL